MLIIFPADFRWTTFGGEFSYRSWIGNLLTVKYCKELATSTQSTDLKIVRTIEVCTDSSRSWPDIIGQLDCETFRIPPLMYRRTIRIPDEGGWRRRRVTQGHRQCHLLRRRDRVEQKFNADWSGANAQFKCRIIIPHDALLEQTARYMLWPCISLSVCLSVCPSQVRVSWYTETAKRRITQTTPHDSPGTLVSWCQRPLRNSTGVTPYGDTKYRWDMIGTFDK